MKSAVGRAVAAFSCGLLFAAGLGISGMTKPQNVIGFLDLTHWNPSLMFVMIGAIGVHAPLYRWIRRRSSPLLDASFHVPTRTDINVPLVLGSALFGVGWGLGGYCPGPALVSTMSFTSSPVLFVAAMIAGIALMALN